MLLQRHLRHALVAFTLLTASQGLIAREYTPLAPTTTQEITTIEILEKLRVMHFSSIPIDDALSSQLFDGYLKALDPNRAYLSQQDIAEFSEYRFKFDNMLKRGDLDAAFTMFNRYQQRYIDRVEKNIAMLSNLENFKFDSEEELVIDRSELPWLETPQEFDDLWRRTLKYQLLSLKLAGKTLEDSAEQLLRRNKNNLDRTVQIVNEDVYQLFVNSLTSIYDPHTSYFSPRTSENFNISMSLSLEGIGAVLQREDEYTKVLRVVKGGPAEKQGELKAADRIVGVAQGSDGEFVDVIGWRLDEVVDLVRGPKDSVVKLEIIPSDSDEGERKVVTITRNKVKLEDQSAQKKIVETKNSDGEIVKIGVIQIPAFYIDFEALRNGDPEYKSTTRDVQNLLNELIEENNIEGLIVDLRGNGGGSLQEANALTGLFIEAGPTVQIRKASNRVLRQGKPIPTAFYEGPLVVMIDRLSASASEIFAGAIQDYKRGIIVGEQSFGKGTVQSLAPLESGQLKLTESKFYRISGESTQHRGVIPDIHFPVSLDHSKVGESALDAALPWDTIHPVRHYTYGLDEAMVEAAKVAHDKRIDQDPDFIFVEKRYQALQTRANRKTLPLNESKLKALREADRQVMRDLENARRKAKGEALLSEDEIKDMVAAETEPTIVEGTEEEDTKASDFYLEEAAKIMGDTFFKSPPQLANSNNA
jgi:carboxyl-terminal processing protease